MMTYLNISEVQEGELIFGQFSSEWAIEWEVNVQITLALHQWKANKQPYNTCESQLSSWLGTDTTPCRRLLVPKRSKAILTTYWTGRRNLILIKKSLCCKCTWGKPLKLICIAQYVECMWGCLSTILSPQAGRDCCDERVLIIGANLCLFGPRALWHRRRAASERTCVPAMRLRIAG